MKYTCVKTAKTPIKVFFPGDFVEIKKLKHPAKLQNGTYHYKELTTGIFMSKNFIKKHFKLGRYKSIDYTIYSFVGIIIAYGLYFTF